MGTSDYDWSNLPPLTEQQKQDVAAIVDAFKNKEDVQAWANANAGRADPAVFAAVVGAADQRKLVSLAASLGVVDKMAKQGALGVVNKMAKQGSLDSQERSTPVVDALIAEADGYAATLIKAGVLAQADYDTQKATAKGGGWTLTTATAWRDSTKKALDDYNAKQGGAGWLLPVGIAAAAFLALRK
jgi:hypothetical protein